MSIHPDGTGTGWTNVEAVDIDQPHGKDYLYSQHIAKGVRKRSNKEHKAFADATAGGEHLPGGCRILGITDATADITKGAGDASIDITDGKFIGRGLIYDQTTNSFWCFTGDGTVSADPYEIMFGPRSVCAGGDYTWSGEHQFDGSGYFTSPVEMSTVDISGHLYVDSSTDISALYIAGDASIDGNLACGSQFSVVNNLNCNSTSTFNGQANFAGLLATIGSVQVASSDITEDSDNASLAEDVTYKVDTDGYLVVCCSHSGGAVHFAVRVGGSTPLGAGDEIGEVNLSHAGVGVAAPITAFIPRNHFWCITLSTGSLYRCRWYPFGDGSCDKNI